MTTYKVGQVLTHPIDKKTRTLLFNDQLVWFFKTAYGLHIKYGWCYESDIISQGWTPQEEECNCHCHRVIDGLCGCIKNCKHCHPENYEDKPQEIEELDYDYDFVAQTGNITNKINEIIRFLNK